MHRRALISRPFILALSLGGSVAVINLMATAADAQDAITIASERSTAQEPADPSVPITLVQRRVRVYGPPIPPGPIPPFGPAFVPVAPVGPPVAPGPTRVRVRVPYFSGDFYVDGVPPGVVVEPQPGEVEGAGPAANGRAGFGARAQNVTLSSNARYRELVISYRDLWNQFSRLTTGDKWKTYLQLPLEPVPSQSVFDYLTTDEGRSRLDKCLARYDRIASDAKYAVVAELPAFSSTHEALRSLAEWLANQPVLAAPERPLPPPPEEIPLP